MSDFWDSLELSVFEHKSCNRVWTLDSGLWTLDSASTLQQNCAAEVQQTSDENGIIKPAVKPMILYKKKKKLPLE
eukprot:Pgem_evm1s6943